MQHFPFTEFSHCDNSESNIGIIKLAGHGKQTFEQPGLPHTPVMHWGSGVVTENLSLGSDR